MGKSAGMIYHEISLFLNLLLLLARILPNRQKAKDALLCFALTFVDHLSRNPVLKFKINWFH
jgi:hypothetical protein